MYSSTSLVFIKTMVYTNVHNHEFTVFTVYCFFKSTYGNFVHITTGILYFLYLSQIATQTDAGSARTDAIVQTETPVSSELSSFL